MDLFKYIVPVKAELEYNQVKSYCVSGSKCEISENWMSFKLHLITLFESGIRCGEQPVYYEGLKSRN